MEGCAGADGILSLAPSETRHNFMLGGRTKTDAGKRSEVTVSSTKAGNAMRAAVTRFNAQTAAGILLGALFFAAAALVLSAAPASAEQLSPDEARAIAKEATIYGFPLVDSYRIQYSYFVDRSDPEFKGPWNTVISNARVSTPDDKAIQSPNADTPYSFLGADLRAEPLVITVPAIEKDRYYSLQFIDMYTFNFAYVGSRTTGNDAGKFLLAGPDWHGETPPGVKAVIRSETEFAFVIYRTQLFTPVDIDNVKRIQAGYKVEPLSHFLNKPSTPLAPPLRFITPLSAEEERTSPEFFNVLNFVLGFCPPNAVETKMLARFAELGIGPRKTFDPQALSPEMLQAVQDGMADAWAAFKEFKETQIDTGRAHERRRVRLPRVLERRLSGPDVRGRARHLRQLEGRGHLSRLFRR